MTAVDRNVDCRVKWCDETGTHAVHRKYMASVKGGTRGAGLVGVNIAQRVQPRASVCVELTVTTPWASRSEVTGQDDSLPPRVGPSVADDAGYPHRAARPLFAALERELGQVQRDSLGPVQVAAAP